MKMNLLRSRFLLILFISLLLTVALAIGVTLATSGQPTIVRVVLLTVIVVLLGAIILIYFKISNVNRLIQVLIGIARKVQINRISPADLRQLRDIASRRDDIGRLATVLHDMALVISEREQHHSEEIAHLQAQVRSDSQQATGLEMAYYQALCRKSTWLRQTIQNAK